MVTYHNQAINLAISSEKTTFEAVSVYYATGKNFYLIKYLLRNHGNKAITGNPELSKFLDMCQILTMVHILKMYVAQLRKRIKANFLLGTQRRISCI